MQRNPLGKEMAVEALHRLSRAELTLILGTPSLRTVLRGKRLRYLLTLIRAAPVELWTVLKAKCRWLDALKDDMEWLARMVGQQWPLATMEHWPEWWHPLKDRPGRFRRLVGKAMERASIAEVHPDLDSESVAVMDSHRRGQQLLEQKHSAAASRQAHWCIPCGICFCRKANLACICARCMGAWRDIVFTLDLLYARVVTRCTTAVAVSFSFKAEASLLECCSERWARRGRRREGCWKP